MDSDEQGQENRAIYNVILVSVTFLAITCGLWINYSAPAPPSVRLDSLSATYAIKPAVKFPLRIKYDNVTYFVKLTVKNEETKMKATLHYLDIWINTRVGAFLRSKLGQKLMLNDYELGPGEEKEFEVEVQQDRPVRITEWPKLLVSVFVKARFPETKDLYGQPRVAYKTRDCANLNATLHNATNTATLENNQLPRWCNDAY